MSKTYRSQVRKRTYKRKFDHELARELYATGIYTKAQLATYFGISMAGLEYAIKPGRKEQLLAYSRTYNRRNARKVLDRQKTAACCDCGAPIKPISKRCRTCHRAKVSYPTFNEVGEVFCHCCHEFKPDSEYSTDFRYPSRGNLRTYCRPCSNATRREYRARHPEKEREYYRRYRKRKLEYYRRRWRELKGIADAA